MRAATYRHQLRLWREAEERLDALANAGSAASWPGSRCPGSGPAWPACWRTLFQREGKSREFDLLSKSLANLLRLWAEV